MSPLRRAQAAGYSAPFISKSKFLWGLQCPKLLWHAYNAKHLIPEPGPQQQAVFDQGHQVGELAKQLYPGGIEIAEDITDLDKVLALSKQALNERRPLFEAAFAFNGGYARADILNPAGRDEWDVTEVKSTTEVKDVHLEDLAFQAFVCMGAGLKIRRCLVMHINRDYVRQGTVNPALFFAKEDVTESIMKLAGKMQDRLQEMFGVIRLAKHPNIRIGPRCDDPYPCPLHDSCWEFLPPNNVLDLYRGTKKGFGLLDRGITSLKDIPGDIKLTTCQAIQKQVAVSGRRHVNKRAIAKFLRGLIHPLHFLDFETFATAIPLFDGLRPYQQVPFQFSLHIVRTPGAEPEHIKFLAQGRHDPRPAFMLKLRDGISRTGSIIAFNASFELGRLRECCEAMPNFSPWLKGVERRVVDLLVPFKSFHYYHPDQRGSASMKAVLPALTGKGYEGLAIQEGDTASREFLRVTFCDVSEEERRRVRQQLEAYCGRDTLGMIWILDRLRTLVGDLSEG